MALWPPRLIFSNHTLERRYQAGQKAKLVRTDAGLYLTNACLWLLGSLWLTLGRGYAAGLNLPTIFDIRNPETLQRFWAIFHELSLWVFMLLPWQPLGPPPTSRADEPAVHHCVAVTVTVNLLLGFYLPSVTDHRKARAPAAVPMAPAVYVSERRSRAEFLWREVTARGLGLAQAGEQLGLPAQELAKVCLFDPMTEWLRWAMLLPPLAAAMWLLASTLAVPWVSDPARQP
ncbi:hypothetical protein N2152v2_007741 [Parachlorella kessleri]